MSASGIYGKTRLCAGIVGYADLTLGDRVGRVLDAHVAAGNGRFRGIRNTGAWDADPAVMGALAHAPEGLYRDAHFREGIRHLQRLGLSFDAWVLEPHIDYVI